MSFSNADRDAGRERADSFGRAGEPSADAARPAERAADLPPNPNVMESGIQLTVAARNRAPFRPLETEFDLEEQVGEGAFGVVFRAVERSTGRRVAVKRLHAIRRAGDLERLQLEMKAIVQLNHPHIVQLYRFQQDKLGHYLVLEWAAGGTLEDRLESGEVLPYHEVVALARKLGSALVYAHRHQIVHRDIKPGNILLTDSGEPKLADFGLAISPSTGTRTSSSGGSLLYAAPEQFAKPNGASNHSIDGRADLFALGKTLYHLATGQPPVSVHIDDTLPRPLRRVIARCVEDDPAKRYPSAVDFLADLERAHHATILGDAGARAFDWLSSRTRIVLASVSLAIVVAVVALSLLMHGGGEVAAAKPAALAPPNTRLVPVSGLEVADDGQLRAAPGAMVRLRLDPTPDGIVSRDVRISGDGIDLPLNVDANYSAPFVAPRTPGRYEYRAFVSGSDSRSLATTTVVVVAANDR